jgi:hypothetical protein
VTESSVSNQAGDHLDNLNAASEESGLVAGFLLSEANEVHVFIDNARFGSSNAPVAKCDASAGY